ncbi:hypothetical protein WMY93_006560 [Mugilogobius chulae]|uniref:Ig-like domain-containing protein n=1 Tax=Mugilogobius chulae TaxID=88201 RepID=A0AAW0PK73_9GOBI
MLGSLQALVSCDVTDKMKIFSTIFAVCCFRFVNGTSMNVKGPEGGEVSFRCHHKLAHDNRKYFCKDPCKSEKDVLATVKPGSISGTERLFLQDHKDGSFTVTLSHLKKSDKGTYFCGVDRIIMNTYTAVYLDVTDGLSYKTTAKTQVSTITEATSTLEYHTFTNSLLTESVSNSSQGNTIMSLTIWFTTENTTTTGTPEKQKSFGFALYWVVGVVALFTVTMIVALCFRKYRQKVRTRPQEDQRIYMNVNFYKPVRSKRTSTLSRSDHFPSYVQPLPALPEKDTGTLSNNETFELIVCSKPIAVMVREGDSVNFTCKYPAITKNNTKFFCWARPVCSSFLIAIYPFKHSETNGRFALHDDSTAGQFVVQMDRLDPEDNGTYWCGVESANNPDIITVFHLNVTPTYLSESICFPEHSLPVFVTVVSCLSALVIVFLFTLCLIFSVRNRRHTQQRARAREMSADYEVMMSGVLPVACSCPDFETSENNPKNPPPGVRHCTEQRPLKLSGSFAALEVLTEVGVPGRFSQYQGLDLGSVDEHVYHGITKPTHL